ncbi:hypothetical protein BC828DRAFT_147821 [Blastocladiella britannica]|nr:hypothetical protein BC828DRAFT_147821 [Blastocladiella britannica]
MPLQPTKDQYLAVVTAVLKAHTSDGRQRADLFRVLPPRKLFPDYYELIPRPFSIQQIKTKIEKHQYSSLQAIKADFDLMFANCQTYNEEGSEIYADSLVLAGIVNAVVAEQQAALDSGAVAGATDRAAAAAPETPDGALATTTRGRSTTGRRSSRPHSPTGLSPGSVPLVIRIKPTLASTTAKRTAADALPDASGRAQPATPAGPPRKRAKTSMAAPAAPDTYVWTADEIAQLTAAVEAGDLETVRALFAQQPAATPNSLVPAPHAHFGAHFTWSPLHMASFNGQDAIVDWLMENGGNVEAPDTWYRGAALAWAAYGGNVHTCRQLILAYNADPYRQNATGQTAADIVSDPDNPDWLGVLFQGSAPGLSSPVGTRRTLAVAAAAAASHSGLATPRSAHGSSAPSPLHSPALTKQQRPRMKRERHVPGTPAAAHITNEGVNLVAAMTPTMGHRTLFPQATDEDHALIKTTVEATEWDCDRVASLSDPITHVAIVAYRVPNNRVIAKVLDSLRKAPTFRGSDGKKSKTPLIAPLLTFPTRDQDPEYQMAVPHPFSFADIEARRQRAVKHGLRALMAVAEFRHMVLRTFFNAWGYYDPESEEYKASVEAKQIFEQEMQVHALNFKVVQPVNRVQVGDVQLEMGQYVAGKDGWVLLIDKIGRCENGDDAVEGTTFCPADQCPLTDDFLPGEMLMLDRYTFSVVHLARPCIIMNASDFDKGTSFFVLSG